MTLHGPAMPPYPSSTTLEPTPQEFDLNLFVATDEAQLEFKSYDGARALVEFPPRIAFRVCVPVG